MSEVLTVADIITLAAIIDTAQRNAKVAWQDEDGDLHYGIARHIVKSPDNFGFLGRNEDVRDGYLRITGKTGFEHALSIRALIQMHRDGTFAAYNW